MNVKTNLDEGTLDALFPDLEDQRGSAEPITAAERAARRTRFAAALAERGFDGCLMEAGATLDYLTDVSWGHSERLFGLVLLADGSAFWISPSFEEARARAKLEAAGLEASEREIVTWQEHEYAYRPLAAELERRRVRRLAIEPTLRHGFVALLQQSAPGVAMGSGHEVVAAVRGIKDAHEIALLRRANELTQEALLVTSERIDTGMTSRDVAACITHAQRKLGLTGIWNLTLFGPEAALPHGSDAVVTLEKGGLILIDTGGSFHGYQSDNTRTWIHDGKPTAEVERAWHAVHDAQARAFEAIRPGIPCKAVDRAARESFASSGYPSGYEHFTHRLGHGIGMQGHEAPYFDGGSEVILEPGMTFSDEPGLYYAGSFGCRLEDIVVVTKDGADHFGSWQRSPLSPA